MCEKEKLELTDEELDEVLGGASVLPIELREDIKREVTEFLTADAPFIGERKAKLVEFFDSMLPGQKERIESIIIRIQKLGMGMGAPMGKIVTSEGQLKDRN